MGFFYVIAHLFVCNIPNKTTTERSSAGCCLQHGNGIAATVQRHRHKHEVVIMPIYFQEIAICAVLTVTKPHGKLCCFPLKRHLGTNDLLMPILIVNEASSERALHSDFVPALFRPTNGRGGRRRRAATRSRPVSETPRAASLPEPVPPPPANGRREIQPDGGVALPLLPGIPLPANRRGITGLRFQQQPEKLTPPRQRAAVPRRHAGTRRTPSR